MGHRVAAAENGRVALETLRREPFDLALLDIEMPEMDGFQVLEQIRGDLALRDVPVIVTSSLEGLDNVVRCIELGAEDYLTKPVNPVLLQGPHRRESREEAAARPAEGARAPLRDPRGGAGPAAIGLRARRQAHSRVGHVLRHPRVSRRWPNRSRPRKRSSCSTRITR